MLRRTNWRRVVVFTSAAVLLALLLAPAIWSENRAASVAALTDAFDEAAFWWEWETLPRDGLGMWRVPIHVGLSGSGAENVRDLMLETLQVLQTITGIPVDLEVQNDFRDMIASVFEPDHGMNLVVLLVPAAQYTDVAARFGAPDAALARLESESHCYTDTPGSRLPLQMEYVIVRDELQGAPLARCVRHELVHAFGLPGHPKGIRSLMNNGWAWSDRLTVNDLILLRALYDPLIHPDMSRAEVLAVIPFIIAELRAAVAATDGDPLTVLGQPLRDLPEPEVSAR